METSFFEVAGHCFSILGDIPIPENYTPFLKKEGSFPLAFSMACLENASPVSYKKENSQDTEGKIIISGVDSLGNSVFEFLIGNHFVGQLICSLDYTEGKLIFASNISLKGKNYLLNNAIMLQYALAVARKNTVLFHGAVVEYKGKGFMFLGESGTGKSTHARLWQTYNEGTSLLNDDNPVVKIFEKEKKALVYGSPWSGKTPCYKNRQIPLEGIVVLEQAPYNKMKQLKGVEAYIPIKGSISGKRWDAKLADGLYFTENFLSAHIPVWLLKCLPDKEAAKLSLKHVYEKD